MRQVRPELSIVVATYRRERVLVETIEALFELEGATAEILVVDQTPAHEPEVAAALQRLSSQGRVRHIRVEAPNIPAAMNLGLRLADAPIVLFVDDDVRPSPDLARMHLAAHREGRAALIAGQVIQPWDIAEDAAEGAHPPPLWGRAGEGGSDKRRPLREAASEPNSPPSLTLPHEEGVDRQAAVRRPCFAGEFLGCNFSVDREIAILVGGFDENFARAAYRFEAEFAHRLERAGHCLIYEPRARLRHLKSPIGGTRAFSDHLRTARPDHTVGAYYYLLRTWRGWPSLHGLAKRPIEAVATRHHLHAPWWIPLTLIGEAIGVAWAVALALRGPKLIAPC